MEGPGTPEQFLVMPWYAELLAAVLVEPDPAFDDGSAGTLLATLLERARRVEGARSPIDRMALELRYDVALIRLCSAVGLPSDPRRFDPPAPARVLLEGQLRAAGLPVPRSDLESASSDGSG